MNLQFRVRNDENPELSGMALVLSREFGLFPQQFVKKPRRTARPADFTLWSWC